MLDGCRLDYVYEPDFERIDARVSRMLSRGKLVAWFQGPMDFGTRSLGGRSILLDPSSRYARENTNRYLRHRPDDQPPPLVMLSSRTAECLADRVSSPLAPVRARVKEDWRLKLQAGVDASGYCRVHTIEPGTNRLAELLAAHEAESGVPGAGPRRPARARTNRPPARRATRFAPRSPRRWMRWSSSASC